MEIKHKKHQKERKNLNLHIINKSSLLKDVVRYGQTAVEHHAEDKSCVTTAIDEPRDCTSDVTIMLRNTSARDT